MEKEKDGLYEMLLGEISKMPVIDTHEHLPWNEESRVDGKSDVLSEYLQHYLKSDLLSAGFKPANLNKVVDTERDIAERWGIVEPFWEVCRYTGYGQSLDIAAKGIYGVDGVRRDTVEELNRRFLENKKIGHYQRVLKNLCGIEVSLLDDWTFHDGDKSEFFKFIWRPQSFIMPSESLSWDILEQIEKRYSISVKCLDDWLEALQTMLDDDLETNDVRVIKSAAAYFRPLRFEKVEYATAKAFFAQALSTWENGRKNGNALLRFPRELQDFMMHHVMKLSNERNLTFQFHTGLLEGNGNTLSNSDPSLLTNLFLEYPDVDFDLFHIGYPYQGIACALSKMFPNVFIDMCWAHIISPFACVSALGDLLDAVPYNKISAFGGDYLFVDGVYGQLAMSRQNISRTLVGKVACGVFDEGKALEIAKALYYDNPKRIFKLNHAEPTLK